LWGDVGQDGQERARTTAARAQACAERPKEAGEAKLEGRRRSHGAPGFLIMLLPEAEKTNVSRVSSRAALFADRGARWPKKRSRRSI
jgi:hypothetical protein